ncbi:RING finger protein 207-like [Sycon ciliatum]|uniref:RING finger protein 207-like n=1 Tax=Sycon ciliatum TaxID=27933 RepID=UPI0031F6B8F4
MVEEVTEALEASVLRDNSTPVQDVGQSIIDPFLCPKCRKRLENPKLFPGCHHSVCGKCSSHLDPDTHEVTCSSCQYKCLQDELLDDRILSFLLEVSGNAPTPCANCEENATLFCATCDQPLCGKCRDLTHATRMFASHTILQQDHFLVGMRNKICPAHNREYVMYTTETNQLLCLTCFSLITGSGKSLAVDVECALPTCTDRLKASVAKLEQLQTNVLESIDKIEGLLEETDQNADSAKDTIEQVIIKLEDKLQEKRQALMEVVEKQKDDKLRRLDSQLKDLTMFAVIVKNSLETGNIFSGSSNVHQFLDLVTDLIERLEIVSDHPQQIYAMTNSQIGCHYRRTIMKCVDEVLGPNMHSETGSNFNLDFEHVNGHSHSYRSKPSAPGMPDISNGHKSDMASATTYFQRQCSNALSPDGFLEQRQQQHQQQVVYEEAFLDALYAERSRAFTTRSKALEVKLNTLRTLVQDLHRDVTHRRCEPDALQLSKIMTDTDGLGEELDEQKDAVESVEDACKATWQRMIDRVDNTRHMYESNLDDIKRMLRDLAQLVNIVKSIQPYILSLRAVNEQLHPVLEQQSRERAKQEVMSDILGKISNTTPNTRQRVEAIQTAEDLRLTSVERKRSNPLEDNLIRTKESLKSRPANMRRHPGSAQTSPIKEVVDLPAVQLSSSPHTTSSDQEKKGD